MALAGLFFIIALIYACVGFGGGSTYTAVLALQGVDYQALPVIALTCNIIVVCGGVWHFSKNKHLNIVKAFPWISLSIPAAWAGGFIQVSENLYIGLLGSVLFLSAIKMFIPIKNKESHSLNAQKSPIRNSPFVPPIIGASLGFIAGLTGIGGGIFLAPVLHLTQYGNSKTISGTCSLFILVNSIFGLLGQSMKIGNIEILSSTFFTYWMLLPAVFIGGQIGSWLGSSRIPVNMVKKLTALLILYVSLKLLSSA
jgi:uncharacterized membrane protein YfcA